MKIIHYFAMAALVLGGFISTALLPVDQGMPLMVLLFFICAGTFLFNRCAHCQKPIAYNPVRKAGSRRRLVSWTPLVSSECTHCGRELRRIEPLALAKHRAPRRLLAKLKKRRATPNALRRASGRADSSFVSRSFRRR